MKKDFVEQEIISAVKELFLKRVNEILNGWNMVIPLFEFGDYGGLSSVTPVIFLSSCEQTEKERIIKLDTYLMTISISVAENPESELFCYGYANAFEKALGEDITLGGIADRAVVISKKYVPPKILNCGMNWEIVLSLRITVEQMKK
ncbi:MAG: hypothetical protein FWC97_03265 [Treponema sp.]|nr:hypothetical protein [Treponema sp.]